ncbi:MAG: hypothetical protein WCY37_03755 [Candidatus Dojkabacteria bacterium]
MSKKLFSKFIVLLLVVGLLFAVAPTAQALAQTPVTKITPLNMQGWTFTKDGTSGGVHGLIQTPTTPPLGMGALHVSLSNTTTSQKAGIVSSSFNGVRLDSITKMEYSTYRVAAGLDGSANLNLQFVLSNGPSNKRLIYEPYWNGTQQLNQWQTWNALTGRWWTNGVTPSTNPCGMDSPCTLTTLLSLYPNAAISGSVYLLAGTYARGLDAYADNLQISHGTTERVFDFDIDPLHIYVDDDYTVATAGWGVDHFDKIQDGINAAWENSTVTVYGGTYNEDLTIAKSISLEGAGIDQSIVNGVSTATQNGMVNITGSNLTIKGFTFNGASSKTIQFTAATNNVTFTNNKVVGAVNASGANNYTLMENNNNTSQTGHVISSNTFVGNNTTQMVYFNPTSSGITFTNNTFTGSIKTGGIGLVFDAPANPRTITGNSFDGVTGVPYALLGVPGSTPTEMNALLTGNTFPAGYAVVGTDIKLPKAVVNVTKGIDYDTIQAAVDVASDGDVITVAPGTYEGFSVVGKTNIKITGAGQTGITINGAGAGAPIIAPTVLINTGVGHKTTANMFASVFVNNSTGITIEGMVIKSTADQPGPVGGPDAIVFWNNSTGTIKDVTVQGIYTINGNQTGQGIAVDGATSVLSLLNTDISGFNKNAIDVVDGNSGTTVPGNLTVNVSGGTITGAGPITATAQNGISYWNRAGGVLGGSITGATISGFDYTPDTNSATGILAYGLGGGTLTVSDNTFSASEIFMTDITGTLNLYSILMGNTFPDFTGVFGDSIMVSPTKMLMDPATFATTDTCTGTHEVTVKVQDVTDLAAYYLNMTYDADLITVTNVENLTLVGAATPGNTWAGGEIHFGWRPVTGIGDPVTYNGNVDLVKITFKSNGLAGTSEFTILPSSALEEWPNAFGIPFEITGGTSVSFGSIVTNTTQTKSYCDLAVAVAEAAGGDTLRVDANITSNVSITVDKALTLNTNGLTISRTIVTTPNNSFAVVPGGDLTITGGGTITATSGTAIRIAGDETTQAKVTLVDATLYAPYFSVAIVGNTTASYQTTAYKSLFVMTGGHTNETVMVQGNGAEAEITGGTLTGATPIMGNGNASSGGTKITVGGDAVVGSPTLGWAAIFHPQDGELTINGGTIQGYNGIEMEAGDLVITGGTIEGYGTCVATPVWTEADGSTNTGDAVLILHQDGYSAGDMMNVTISGGTIKSTSCYALREFDLGGNTSELALATITGGHYTGGALGAVYFATNNATNLELVGGDYSADPIAYVYDPYGTYLNTDNRWYIAPLPVISSTDFDDQVTLGVETTFDLTITNSIPGTFDMVFTGYPSETQITYNGTTYYCVGDPCVITVPVTLTGVTPVTLPFAITVATAGTEIPATSYAVAVTMHAPTYGTTGRDLATLSATVPVTPGFSVSGTVTMQGRMTRAGVPVYLTWENSLGVTYGPSMDTDEAAVNFRLAVNYGGTYTITTLQPRFLNITADLLKQVTLTGDYTFANPLWLRAGNAIWQPTAGVYDNAINVNDATLILNKWGTDGKTTVAADGLDPILDNSGDVNFDNIVSIKDLTLVGGNMDLTSALAYGGTLWIP